MTNSKKTTQSKQSTIKSISATGLSIVTPEVSAQCDLRVFLTGLSQEDNHTSYQDGNDEQCGKACVIDDEAGEAIHPSLPASVTSA